MDDTPDGHDTPTDKRILIHRNGIQKRIWMTTNATVAHVKVKIRPTALESFFSASSAFGFVLSMFAWAHRGLLVMEGECGVVAARVWTGVDVSGGSSVVSGSLSFSLTNACRTHLGERRAWSWTPTVRARDLIFIL